MALAKKCDRCGKLYEHSCNYSQYNALRIIQKNITGSTINGNTEYDLILCQECMEELTKFIAARRIIND